MASFNSVTSNNGVVMLEGLVRKAWYKGHACVRFADKSLTFADVAGYARARGMLVLRKRNGDAVLVRPKKWASNKPVSF
jgi:hypothetical protein